MVKVGLKVAVVYRKRALRLGRISVGKMVVVVF